LEVVVEEVALQLEAGVAAAAGVGHERAGERGVDAEARRARAEDVARERDEHEAGGEEELVAVDPDLGEEGLDDRGGAELGYDGRHRRAALHGLADARRVEDDVDEEVLEEGRGGDESGAAVEEVERIAAVLGPGLCRGLRVVDPRLELAAEADPGALAE